MKLSRIFLLTFFWVLAAAISALLPMACTNTSSKFLPVAPATPPVASATPTNAFGFTSTPTFTLQPTLTATNTATPAATMQNPSTLSYNPAEPSGIAVVGSPATIYVAGGDGTLSIYSAGSLVTSFTQYNSVVMGSLSGVAVDTTRNLYYVLDSANGAVYEFNCGANTPVNTWNNWSNGNTFSQPGGIAVDANGYVYVADTGNEQIDVFSSGGASSVNQWGTLGTGNGQFDNPSSVAVTITSAPATMVYVADASNQLIQVFNFLGVWQSQFPTAEGSDIFGISLDGSGNVYAADYMATDPLVEEYNSSGILVAQWGGAGLTFFGPIGVAWFGSLLYVADYDNNAIYTLTP